LKNSRILAAAASLAFGAAAAFAAPRPPQDPPPPTATGRPPVVDAHLIKPTPPKNKIKLDKYKGRVLAFNIATIIVQNMENPRMVWSFQYSVQMHQKVADMLSTGPYQPGDKVTVYCNPGTTVAVKIKGKPAKSS